MGKKKAPAAPSFTGGETRYGNTVIGKTFLDPTTGNIVTQYIPDAAEEQRKSLLQSKINEISATLGKTAPELAQQFNDTEKSYVSDATSKFLDEYNPTVKDLRENIGSRFGTLNTSSFFDNLNNLEKTKSSAFADIVNRGKTIKYDLVNNDENQKQSALQTFSNLLNSDQSNFTNNLQSSLSSSSSANDFNNNQWLAKLQDFRQTQSNKKGLLDFIKGRFS